MDKVIEKLKSNSKKFLKYKKDLSSLPLEIMDEEDIEEQQKLILLCEFYINMFSEIEKDLTKISLKTPLSNNLKELDKPERMVIKKTFINSKIFLDDLDEIFQEINKIIKK